MEETDRRRAMRLALLQGVLSTSGAWLVGGWFLTFFAMELGAKGMMVGAVLAVGNMAGLLRIVAPYLVNRCDDRRAVYLWANVIARFISIGLPLLAFPHLRPAALDPLWLLVLLLCGITIANTVGEVAWLSWYADVVPEQLWGRYFARRNMYMAIPNGLVPLVGGLTMDLFVKAHPEARLSSYAVIYGLGIVCHLAALIPMLRVPNLPLRKRPAGRLLAPTTGVWREVITPLRDVNFRRYAYFYCWLMLGSGITQPAFHLYLKNVLGVGLLVTGVFQLVNEIFRILGSRWWGSLTDRFGNKPIVIVCLFGAATGPFFWIPTDRDSYWLISVAYVVWGMGWAGVNLGTQNLMLKLAPQENNVGYIAAAQGLGGVCLAGSILLGGWWLDVMTGSGFSFPLGPWRLNAYHIFFLMSFVGRGSAALWVFSIREPGAHSISRVMRTLRRAAALRRCRRQAERVRAAP